MKVDGLVHDMMRINCPKIDFVFVARRNAKVNFITQAIHSISRRQLSNWVLTTYFSTYKTPTLTDSQCAENSLVNKWHFITYLLFTVLTVKGFFVYVLRTLKKPCKTLWYSTSRHNVDNSTYWLSLCTTQEYKKLQN